MFIFWCFLIKIITECSTNPFAIKDKFLIMDSSCSIQWWGLIYISQQTQNLSWVFTYLWCEIHEICKYFSDETFSICSLIHDTVLTKDKFYFNGKTISQRKIMNITIILRDFTELLVTDRNWVPCYFFYVPSTKEHCTQVLNQHRGFSSWAPWQAGLRNTDQ